MKKKEVLKDLKKSLNEIMDITPYDLIEFSSTEEEKEYIQRKTSRFDLRKVLLDQNDNDGIIVISDNDFYAINPIFIHTDAYRKIFNLIDNSSIPINYGSQDIIDYYNKKGYVLFRVVNNNGVIGCDPYIPEKINDYQTRMLDNISRELNRVHKEIEDIDRLNSYNLEYSMRLIKASVRSNEIVKHL